MPAKKPPGAPLSAAIRAALDAALRSGQTYHSISKIAGVSQQQVSRWYTGERPGMSLATADRVAAALGIVADTKGGK